MSSSTSMARVSCRSGPATWPKRGSSLILGVAGLRVLGHNSAIHARLVYMIGPKGITSTPARRKLRSFAPAVSLGKAISG